MAFLFRNRFAIVLLAAGLCLALAFAATALSLAFCNTVPIAKLAADLDPVFRGAVIQAGDAAAPSIVVIRPLQFGHHPSHVRVELALVNPLNVPITYEGYRPMSFDHRFEPGHIAPFQRFATAVRDGPWNFDERPRCGNGLDVFNSGALVVGAGEAGRFTGRTSRRDAVFAKFAVHCQWFGDGQSHSEEIWSPIVRLMH